MVLDFFILLQVNHCEVGRKKTVFCNVCILSMRMPDLHRGMLVGMDSYGLENLPEDE